MKIIYQAENLIDAQLVKDVLAREGIPAFISGQYLLGGVGELPARDLVAVMVPDSAVHAAQPKVKELDAMLSSPPAQDQPHDNPSASLADGYGTVHA